MKVDLTIVPPGGGEAELSVELDMPAVPRVGEYLIVNVPARGAGAFRVLYVTYNLEAEWEGNGFRSMRALAPIVQIEPVEYDQAFGPANLEHYFRDPAYRGKVQKYPASGF